MFPSKELWLKTPPAQKNYNMSNTGKNMRMIKETIESMKFFSNWCKLIQKIIFFSVGIPTRNEFSWWVGSNLLSLSKTKTHYWFNLTKSTSKLDLLKTFDLKNTQWFRVTIWAETCGGGKQAAAGGSSRNVDDAVVVGDDANVVAVVHDVVLLRIEDRPPRCHSRRCSSQAWNRWADHPSILLFSWQVVSPNFCVKVVNIIILQSTLKVISFFWMLKEQPLLTEFIDKEKDGKGKTTGKLSPLFQR